MTFTEQEQDTIRRGFLGAVALVSQADPGFLDTFKESFAVSKSMQAASPEVRELLKGGLVMPPKAGSAAEMQGAMFNDLTEAMTILDRDPATRSAFSDSVLQACQDVAEAAKGVAPEEQEIIDRVRVIVAGPPPAVS